MSKLELSWEALHRFNPALKFSVYRSGIEEFADEASATEAKNRWANIGREIILAKIKLYCLQDIHVNLAGFEAIEEESVTSVYAALYQQLIACFNNAKTSDKSLRRRRVDRLIGFLAAEIDSGMVGQFLTPTILKESVRQILPAEEALKRYEKKNPGLLGRKVTVITSGVHVRLEFRQRSAVGEGLDVKEAESIAQERLADLLYDGELPTLRATYPQTSRQMHEPTEKMLKWAQIFNISDDLVSRILILDARNETMDSLIESIGHNLCAAYCYSNPDSDFSESASDAVKSLVKAVIHLPKLAEAPFLLIGRQRDIQIQPRILNRMFFYLSPIGGEANSHFAFILNSVAKKSSPVKTDTTEDKILPIPRSAISHDHEEQTPQRREVTPVFKPARQETVTQETVTRAQAGISGFKYGQPAKLTDVLQWVERHRVPYTGLLQQREDPLTFVDQFMKQQTRMNLLITLPRLDLPTLQLLTPLVRHVVELKTSEAVLLAGNIERIASQNDQVSGVTPRMLVALMHRGVKFGDLRGGGPGSFLELSNLDYALDLVMTTPFSADLQERAISVRQFTVSPISVNPFCELVTAFKKFQQPIVQSELEKSMFDDELNELGF